MALGSASKDHLAMARTAYANAKTDYDRMPPTCEGAITLVSRALEANAEARTHLWSMAPSSRRRATKLFAAVNVLDKKLRDVLNAAKFSCKGRIR